MNQSVADPPVEPAVGHVHDEKLSSSDVRQRALAGAATVGLRSVAVRGLGFVVSIALARLLRPQDFGLLAFGQTVVVFAGFIADGGVAGALIRRVEPPTRRELSAVFGFQLALAFCLAAVIAAACFPFGTAGQITSLIVASLPFAVIRTPVTVLLERNLNYGSIARAEIAGTVVFGVWAVVAVALGAGVWGVAGGMVLNTAVSGIWIRAGSSTKGIRPAWDWHVTKPLLTFGIRYAAAATVNAVRDQMTYIATAGIAGLTVVGYLSLLQRVMLIPFMLFQALGRVSLPTIARLLGNDEEPESFLGTALETTAVASGLILVGLAAGARGLVPGIFGAKWSPVTPVIPPMALGLLIVGPLSVAFGGFLYAKGEAGRMLAAMVLYAIAMLAIGLPLLPQLGVMALGIGAVAGSLLEAAVLAITVRRYTPISMGGHLVHPVVAACLAGGIGYAVGLQLPSTLMWGVAMGALGLVMYCAALLVTRRQLMLATGRLGWRGLRSAVSH